MRSGKTLSMSIGFVSWAMSTFRGGSFALCGKTVTALKRNVMTPLVQLLGSLGFTCLERVSKNYVDISSPASPTASTSSADGTRAPPH